MDNFRGRKHLYHSAPAWVADGEIYFITICTKTRGTDQLTIPEVSKGILGSLGRLHRSGKWHISLFLLMPDHLHGLISFPANVSMAEQISLFKSYQSRFLGINWQEGFFDHRIRSDEEFALKAEYIRQNPVRAGLVKTSEDWTYVFPK
ncbi:REP-associated tyrosine transposase [Cerasicoccus fimbriatus]|uniref:REP-associated tyrosine transposase n=1 Tax=Cerasicoccus fimbriatus TaxID=3014554 RepID=UPI0022B51539|nr:transposase [Cerasicoccus sp. TK19100]